MSATRQYSVAIAVGFFAGLLIAGFTLPELAKCDGGTPETPASLFPYAFLKMWISGDLRFACLAFIQFPAYAAILAWAHRRSRVEAVVWRIAFLHLLLGMGAALLASTRSGP